MALLNLIAKSEKGINWDHFFDRYSALNLDRIEVFPIPKELGFDVDCIGVNVHKGYTNRKTVIAQLEQIITFGSGDPYLLKFTELYDGIEIYPANASDVFGKLLPV
ncbi:hypothetical protein [Mucilaginibacter celer]|uniref:Uncharacterized protein n=1 Tax=Mucilaginibacter celer TaxID=2305508 RepID=A0A494W2R4_9SPHI|nr:hypothetical protein [Mucilaginibacter celer]AYL97838.1 hypothetical protein HYN43_022195 [Mucilaginibacter celer]